MLHSLSHELDQTHQHCLLHSWPSAGLCNRLLNWNQSTSSLAIMDQRLHISPTLLNTSVCTSTASFRGTTMLTPSRRKPAALCGSWTEILHIALVTSRNIVISHTLDCNYNMPRATVWSPHTKVNINKLEVVQRNAARYVFQDFSRHSSPTSMTKELQWTSLEQRRLMARPTVMYQTQHGLIDIPSHYTTRSYSRRGLPMTLQQVHCRVKPYEASFFPATVIP